ncbi:nitrite reductase (NAD(P)H), large subunit [gamma proteobacterium HTCC5015]|nr:nitrite reductase (NAD(P)H), large subunit [gamma proteobacterium HTCC5015]
MARKKLVMVGNGMAGVRALEELLRLAPDRYDITVFGAEPCGHYNRIMLSPVLANEMDIDEIFTHHPRWYEEQGITLYTSKVVTKIDRQRQCVIADDGTEAHYDRLLLALGSLPRVLPISGNTLDGVTTYREVRDVHHIMNAARKHRRAVVIGGGLLGLEAAYGLSRHGMEVTVVHLNECVLDRQLDGKASRLLQQYLKHQGIEFLLSRQVAALEGRDRVESVRFDSGEQISADLVVMAAGIHPRIALAKEAGLHCKQGIVVDDCLQTFDPKIYAVGECVQHRGQVYGLVAPLYEQARVCANHLAEIGISRYEGSVLSTSLKVTGISLFSAGDFKGDESTREIVFFDVADSVYKKLVVKDDRLIGALLYGETNDSRWYLDLIRSSRSIAAIRENMVFGRVFCESDEVSFQNMDTDPNHDSAQTSWQ